MWPTLFSSPVHGQGIPPRVCSPWKTSQNLLMEDPEHHSTQRWACLSEDIRPEELLRPLFLLPQAPDPPLGFPSFPRTQSC